MKGFLDFKEKVHKKVIAAAVPVSAAGAGELSQGPSGRAGWAGAAGHGHTAGVGSGRAWAQVPAQTRCLAGSKDTPF